MFRKNKKSSNVKVNHLPRTTQPLRLSELRCPCFFYLNDGGVLGKELYFLIKRDGYRGSEVHRCVVMSSSEPFSFNTNPCVKAVDVEINVKETE